MTTNVGGINIGVGIDLSSFENGVSAAEVRLRSFETKMKNIRLASVIKGDPFGEARKYIKTAKYELDDVFTQWSKGVNKVPNVFGKIGKAARKSTEEVIKAFSKIDQKLKGLAVAKKGVSIGALGFKSGGNKLDFFNSEAFREGLSRFKGLSEKADVAIKKLVKDSEEGLLTYRSMVGVSLGKISKEIESKGDAIEEEYAKVGKDLKHAIKKNAALAFAEEYKQSGSDEVVRERKLKSIKALAIAENRYVTEIKNGFNVKKTQIGLIKLYSNLVESGITLTDKQKESLKKLHIEQFRPKYEEAGSSEAVEKKRLALQEKAVIEERRLNTEIKAGFNVKQNYNSLLEVYNKLTAAGIKLTEKQQREFSRLKKKVRAIKGEYSGLTKVMKQVFSPKWLANKALWFIQLRLLWEVWRRVSEAIQEVIEMNDQLARSMRTMRSEVMGVTEIYRELLDQMGEMAKKHGASFEQTGEVLYQLGSAGLSAEESLAALNSVITLLIGTEGDARELTKSVAGVYNNFAASLTNATTEAEKFKYIVDIMAIAWQNHQVEIGELNQGYRQATAMIKAAGMSFEELTALLSVANDHMIKGGNAGRALQNVFMRISRSPIKFKQAFGLTDDILDPTKPIKLLKIIKAIGEQLSSGAMSAYQLAKSFETLGLRGAPIFTMYIQNFRKIDDAIDEHATSANAAFSLEERRLDSLGGAWTRFVGLLKDLFSELNPVLNAVKDALDGITDHALYKGIEDTIEQFRNRKGTEIELDTVIKPQLEQAKKDLKEYKDALAEAGDSIILKKGIPGLTEDTYLNSVANDWIRKQVFLVKELENEYTKYLDIINMSDVDLQTIVDSYEITKKVVKDLTSMEKKLIIGRATASEEEAKQAQKILDIRREGREDAFREYKRRSEGYSTIPISTSMGDAEFNFKIRDDRISYFERTLELTKKIKEEQIKLDEAVAIANEIKKEDTRDSVFADLANQQKALDELKSLRDSLAREQKTIYDKEAKKGIKLLQRDAERLGLSLKDSKIKRDTLKNQDEYIKNEEEILGLSQKILEDTENKAKIDRRINLFKQPENYEAIGATYKQALDTAKSAFYREEEALQRKIKEEREALSDEKLEGLKKEKELKIQLFDIETRRIERDNDRMSEDGKILSNSEKLKANNEAILKIANDRAIAQKSLNLLNEMDVDLVDKLFKESKDIAKIEQLKKYYAILDDIIEAKKEELLLSYTLDTQNIDKKLNKLQIENGHEDEINALQNERSKLTLKFISDSKDLAVTKEEILDLDRQISEELLLQSVRAEEYLRKMHPVYDAYMRIKDSIGGINKLISDSITSFASGLGSGVGTIMTDLTGGFQAQQQEVINLQGELKELDAEYKNAISEGNVEEAANLKKEMAALNTEISDLEDPIKNIGEAFKDMLKGVVDGVREVINQWIAMQIVMGILTGIGMGATASGASGASSRISNPLAAFENIVIPKGATGGVFPNIKSFKRFSNGGVTDDLTMAVLGDNASKKEIVIPTENISKNNVSGHMQESGGDTYIINAVTERDLAMALSKPMPGKVIVNRVYADLDSRGKIARKLGG